MTAMATVTATAALATARAKAPPTAKETDLRVLRRETTETRTAARATAGAIDGECSGAATALRHDVTEEAAWPAGLEATVAAFGGLHVLVNNAGIAEGGSVEDTDLDTWRRVHAVDLDGVFLGCNTKGR